jgi:hypothetical protein
VKSPGSELAGVAYLTWLKSAGHLDAPAATSRPVGTAWSATGFLVVGVVGDAAGPDSRWEAPILSVDAWAVTPTSGQAPWGHSAGLAEIIRQAAKRGLVPSGTLATKTGFAPVRINTVWAMSEVRRVPEPDGSAYAHHSVDIGLGWVEVPT